MTNKHAGKGAREAYAVRAGGRTTNYLQHGCNFLNRIYKLYLEKGTSMMTIIVS